MKITQAWPGGHVVGHFWHARHLTLLSASGGNRQARSCVDHPAVSLQPSREESQAASAVIEFDANWNYIQGWGGFADAYDWPDEEHGIWVDDKDFGWR